MAQRQSARQSGRGPERNSTRTGAAERQSQRSMGSESRRTRSTRTTAAGGGKVLLICLGVIGLISILCVFLYIDRSGQKRKLNDEKQKVEYAKEQDIDRAYTAFKLAERSGLNFVMGRDAAATDDALFSSLKGKEPIYNIAFYRRYKDTKPKSKDKEKVDERFSDVARNKPIGTGELLVEKEGIKINRGLAEDDKVSIVIAQKHFTPEANDPVNAGGEILVIVKAFKE